MDWAVQIAVGCLGPGVGLCCLLKPGAVPRGQLSGVAWWLGLSGLAWWLGLSGLAVGLFMANGTIGHGESAALVCVGALMTWLNGREHRRAACHGGGRGCWWLLVVAAGVLSLGIGLVGLVSGDLTVSATVRELSLPAVGVLGAVGMVPALAQQNTTRWWGGVLCGLSLLYYIIWLR